MPLGGKAFTSKPKKELVSDSVSSQIMLMHISVLLDGSTLQLETKL